MSAKGIHRAPCCPRVMHWTGRKGLSPAERAILDSAPGARNDLGLLQEKARDVVLGRIYEGPFRFEGVATDIAMPPSKRRASGLGRRGAFPSRRQRP